MKFLNKNQIKRLSTITFFIICSIATYSQEIQTVKKKNINKLPLKDQFEYIYKKSGTYQTYKVVKKEWFFKIQRNALDSLQSAKKSLVDSQKIVQEQKATIAETNEALKASNEKIKKLTNEKESISFFGISLTKSTYNTLMMIIIIALAVLLGLFIYRFKNSIAITKKHKKDLDELEQEFEQHRSKSLEREQKVRRQLQDLINKEK